MYTGILHVLRDGIFYHLALVGHSVKLYLFGFCHELRNHYGEFLRNLGRHAEEAVQLLVVITYVHGSTRQHVRRTNQYGIAHLVHKLLHVVERGQRTPCRLVNAQLVEHGRELVAILGTVNVHWRCAQYGNTLAIQLHGQVVRNLSTH